MAKFNFRLRTLLNVKSQMETNLQNELGREMQKLENEKLNLTNIINEREICIKSFDAMVKKGAEVNLLRQYTMYLGTFKKRIEFQKKTINKFEKSVDIIKGKLIKVVQEKKMLEKLKEKQLEIYTKEELIKEQKTNDEISSYKHLEKN